MQLLIVFYFWIRNKSAATAVEFALVFPLFLAVVLAVVVYGAHLAVVHGVQQLAAEAARSSVGGLDNQERVALAESYVTHQAQAYPLITPSRLTVQAGTASDNANVYVVTVSYDASNMFIYALPQFVPAPSPTIVRAAAIKRGGY